MGQWPSAAPALFPMATTLNTIGFWGDRAIALPCAFTPLWTVLN